MKIFLLADEGMILKDGEEFVTTVSLEKGRRPEEITEITKEEYDRIMAEQEEEVAP